MKKEEIKELSTQDLKDRLAEMEKAYRMLKANHTVSTIDNPAQDHQGIAG